MGAPARVVVRWSAQLDKAPVWLEVEVAAVTEDLHSRDTTSGIDMSADTLIVVGCGGSGAEAKKGHSCLQVPGAFRRHSRDTREEAWLPATAPRPPGLLAPGKGSRVSSGPRPGSQVLCSWLVEG